MPIPVTPLLCVDILIELVDRPGRPLVLIERAHLPLGLAIPGGFVDVGERTEQAARREALEETGLEVTLHGVLGVYSDPARDRRGHSASVAYVASASGAPHAADDAKSIVIVTVEELSATIAACARNGEPLNMGGVPVNFDHPVILEDYLRFRATGQVAPLRGI